MWITEIGQFEGFCGKSNRTAAWRIHAARYAEDARLYVPLERMDLVQNYRVVEGAPPPLTSWRYGMDHAKSACEEVA